MSSFPEQLVVNDTGKLEVGGVFNVNTFKKLSLEDKKDIKISFESEQHQPNKRRKLT